MDFEELPMVQITDLCRSANVSRGKCVSQINELAGEGLIDPTVTPTGRIILKPRDAKLTFEALTASA